MTENEAIAIIENEKKCVNRASKNDYCNRDCYNCELVKPDIEILNAFDMAIKALEQQPCEDAISREAVDTLVDELARAISDERCHISRGRSTAAIMQDILDLPSVTPKGVTVTDFSDKCRECGREKVLDKIRAEIDSAEMPKNRMSFFIDGINCALQIIDRYRAESEDKEYDQRRI